MRSGDKTEERIVAVLAVILLVFLLTHCVPIHTSFSRGTVIYQYEYTGVEFEDELTEEEVKAVVKILSGKERKSTFLFGMPSCGADWDIAIIIDGRRYMLALDTCGTVFIGGTIFPNSCFSYMDISNEEQDILEEIFTSRGGEFPCL